MYNTVQQFDVVIDSWVRRIPKKFDRLFRIISASGFPIVIYGIAGALLLIGLIRHDVFLQQAACVIVVIHIVSSVLKATLRRPRPITYLPHRWTFKTHSFPSGHAAGSLVAYGALAVVANDAQLPASTGVMTLTLVWVLLIGVSRLYLGAHYASDVVGGWMLAACGLVILSGLLA